MSIINRHERCVGVTLFRGKKHNVEIWYCPRGYEVKPHSHNDQHIELMYLFGKTTFHRQTFGQLSGKPGDTFRRLFVTKEEFTPTWKHVLKKFTIKPGQRHWFTVSSLPLIFINFATFIDGKRPVSAAIDFHTI